MAECLGQKIFPIDDNEKCLGAFCTRNVRLPVPEAEFRLDEVYKQKAFAELLRPSSMLGNKCRSYFWEV